MPCLRILICLGALAVAARASTVNPAPPLFAQGGAATTSGGPKHTRLQVVVPPKVGRYLVLRFYPDSGIGRVDSGMFRLNVASVTAYQRFVDDAGGVFSAAKRDAGAPVGDEPAQ